LTAFQYRFHQGILLKKEDDPWVYFYLGAAYGCRALNRFRKHNRIGSHFDAKKGVHHFQKALEEDPRLYDCHPGLGAYHDYGR
jgi:hypothetical protein